MNWNEAADAFIKVWNETGLDKFGIISIVLVMVFVLTYKWLDRRRGKDE